ncbi:MAG TPA: hypothetical protein VEY89_10965, partial [Candidatus Dormibacteraeota bacterium]|nr:hypothetical protein [Candidatus Dormibacteraeota bacterium]
MLFKWLDGSEATQVGTTLADDFCLRSPRGAARAGPCRAHGAEPQKFLHKFLHQVDRAVVPLDLNVFKRAKLANSFKWRLLEKGVEADFADELTQALVMRLMRAGAGRVAAEGSSSSTPRGKARDAHSLHVTAHELLGKGAFAEARESYQ